MVQVTGLEPTRLMRSLAPEASAVRLRNKFRFHEIEDFVLRKRQAFPLPPNQRFGAIPPLHFLTYQQ